MGQKDRTEWHTKQKSNASGAEEA